MKAINTFFVFLFALCPNAYATHQLGDFVEYNSVIYRITDSDSPSPLLSYFVIKETERPKEFRFLSTDLGRGYVAHWRINDGKLWLVSVYVPDKFYQQWDTGSLSRFVCFPLEKIFQTDTPVIMADWFSGEILLKTQRLDFPASVTDENQDSTVTLQFKNGIQINNLPKDSIRIHNKLNNICNNSTSNATIGSSSHYQRGDYVEYESIVYRSSDMPSLSNFLELNKLQVPKEFELSFPHDLSRGYIAHWRITNNKLWLVSIYLPDLFYEYSDKQSPFTYCLLYSLQKFHDMNEAAICADWFSGKIQLRVWREDYLEGEVYSINNICINLKFKDGRIVLRE